MACKRPTTRGSSTANQAGRLHGRTPSSKLVVDTVEIHCMFAGPLEAPSPSALEPLSLGLYQGGWRQPWHGLPRGLGPAETGLQILLVSKSTSYQYLHADGQIKVLHMPLVLRWLTNRGPGLQ